MARTSHRGDVRTDFAAFPRAVEAAEDVEIPSPPRSDFPGTQLAIPCPTVCWRAGSCSDQTGRGQRVLSRVGLTKEGGALQKRSKPLPGFSSKFSVNQAKNVGVAYCFRG